MKGELGNGQNQEVRPMGLVEIIKKNFLFLLVISFVTIAIYANGMGADFVSDDYASITQNPSIGDIKVMWSGGNSAYLLNYFTFKVFGHASSIPYHLVSLLMYIGVLWLAFVFVRIIFVSDLLAGLTIILFAVHPIHVEAVTWVSGRLYLTIAICVLGSTLLIKKYLEEKKLKWLLWAGVPFLVAFQTDRPRPMSLFLVLVVYLLYKGINYYKINWAKVIGGLMVTLVVLVVVMWPYIKGRIDSVNSGYNSSESIFYDPFFQYPTGIAKYLQLMWVPIDLTLYHTMFTFPVWLNWAIFLTYLGMIGYFYFKDRRYFFALSFIMAGVLPSMAPVKVSWLVAERYMFLGSLGFCLFMGLILTDIWQRWRLVSTGILAVIVSLWGVRVVLRNVDWQTNHNLWVNTCQVSPNSHNAWNNIGDDYDKLKDYDNAVKGFSQSTVVKPNYADAYHNRANIFFKMGRLDLARDSYQTALQYSPGLFQTYISLTQIDLMEKKFDLALSHAQEAVKIQPGNPQTYYVMAVVYAEGGRRDEAVEILKKLLMAYPGYQPAREVLDRLMQTGS